MKKIHFDDITETAKRYVPKIRTKSAEIITILLRSDLSSHAMTGETGLYRAGGLTAE
ncbi:MAG: hypothetical protein PW844_26905 [Pantoea sp.]|uniref:hypothetical protein n=1 Tax=Pantoea sp. TaxID=69393 RepID=UPI00239B5220|nr:hypothetical protein [Pantoea sp.]MDE1190049.1 hypothetical protein [Pantoea sp.]